MTVGVELGGRHDHRLMRRITRRNDDHFAALHPAMALQLMDRIPENDDVIAVAEHIAHE